MDVSQLRKLKELEDENFRIKNRNIRTCSEGYEGGEDIR